MRRLLRLSRAGVRVNRRDRESIANAQRAAAFRYADARICYELACAADDVSDEQRAAMFKIVVERQQLAARHSRSARWMYDDAVAEQKFWTSGPRRARRAGRRGA